MSEGKTISEEMQPMQQNLDAAVGVLGSMLIDENAVGPMLTMLADSDFLLPEHQLIFRAFRKRYGAGQAVDPILINEELGGTYGPFLLELMRLTPTAANANAYAEEVRRTSRLHQLREIGSALAQATGEDNCRELIDKANLLFCQRTGIRRINLEKGVRAFFLRHGGNEQRPNYLPWFLHQLNDNLHVGRGDMVVLGGYPSAGKTAFALQEAFHIAKTMRVGFFSYETSNDKLLDRTIACQTQTSFGKMMAGTLELDDYSRIRDAREFLSKPTLDFLETSGMTVSDIGAQSMAFHYDVIIVDYLQKINMPKTSRFFNETERVGQISNDLQQLGRTTGKIIVALSQLSRPDKKGGNIEPSMSDLRQSGQIEQDADVILLLWKEYPNAACSRRCLKVSKNKDGESSLNLMLDFDGEKQEFRKSQALPTSPYPVKKKKDPESPLQANFFHPIPGEPCEIPPFEEESQ